jgi:hypothetical protein
MAHDGERAFAPKVVVGSVQRTYVSLDLSNRLTSSITSPSVPSMKIPCLPFLKRGGAHPCAPDAEPRFNIR